MNSAEAKEMTEFGIWTKISSSIKELIEEACNDGKFEINISNIYVNESDVDRLAKLGYSVTYDGTDKFDPRYYISWKY
jgi:hypothetical protein